MEKLKNLKFKDLFSNDDDIMTNEENNREPSEPASVLHESFISEAQVAMRRGKRRVISKRVILASYFYAN